MKRNLLSVLSLFVLGVLMSSFITSCSKDDEPKIDPNPASKITGSYVGTGHLAVAGLSGMSVLDYPGMKIQVSRSSNEYVIVTPYFADGSPMFSQSTGDVYYITQTANGDFILTDSSAPQATLKISRNGEMDYYYPYVAYKGESGYALVFNGKIEN